MTTQAGAHLLGRFLVMALQQPPSAEALGQLLPLLTDLPMEPVNPEMTAGAALLGDYARQAAGGDLAAEAARLRADYTALFEGPGPMAAPPWESVYRTEEQVLFGPTTAQVREAYRRWGLGLEHEGREPEDHIALELAFLLYLAEQPEGAAEYHAFLRAHLLRWIRPFCSLMEDGASTLYYQGVARLLLGYVLALDTVS